MRLFSIFTIFVPAILAGKTSPPPPKPFENFGNAQGLYHGEMTAAATHPPLFWNYYPTWKAEHGVSYTRSSPASWRGVADSSPLRGYHAGPKEDAADDGGNLGTESGGRRSDSGAVLDLSHRPRISHGPRRRRRRRHSAGKNSAKCRGLAIDCALQRNHICCLREEGGQQRRGTATVFQDPEFGIPLDRPPPSFATITDNRRPANAISARNDEKKKELAKRRWTVGSSLVPLIPYAPNYRCPVDCWVHHRHPCCTPVDRFAPIEPYVQPSLLENWVTTLFVAFGNDPAAYLLAKKAVLVGMFFLGLALWGWMGSSFGWLDGMANPFSSRIGAVDGVDDLANDVISAVDGQAWLNKLSAREAVRGEGSTINRFVCCFKEADEGDDSGRGIRCLKRTRKRRKGPDVQEMSVLDCVSKLAYEVTMNSTQNKS